MTTDPPDQAAPDTDAVASAARPKRRGLEGRIIGERYEVTRTVAAGANTLIAVAVDTELDRAVTVKLVRPELSESADFRRRFAEEMERVVGISHPNIGAIYDWGEQLIGKRATVYVVGESLTGGSLRDLYDRGRWLTPSQALMVGLEACRGLDFAHQNGLVHTELTPSKLVFGDDRRLRIVDFGLARILGDEEWREPSRVATHVARYASPEQAQGVPVDGKTDVYSLALILIEGVTGSVPFAAESTVATLSARAGRLMPVDADLGPLASVLERAGRPDSVERSTAAQFGRALVQAAPRLPRPTPIPTLTASLFEQDPSAMRRPNDPTGGIERPPAEPEPMLVPPTASDTTTAASSNEPAGADGVGEPSADAVPAAPGATPDEDAAVTAATAPVAERGAGAATGAVASARPSSTGEYDDLAALVERTPRTPPPAADAAPASTAKLSRKQRRAARKQGQDPAATAGRPPAPLPATPPAEPAPRRRRWLAWLVALFMVAVLVGLGAIAYMLFRTPTHPIPDVAGLDRDAAVAEVDDFDWSISFEDVRSDDHPTPGEVVRTAPAAGDDLAEGSPLLIFVSEGPEFRQVPDLSGMTLDDAQAQIESLQLTAAEPTQQFSETVPKGTVISSASGEGVPIGGDVLPDSEITLVVSAGPQPRTAPQLRGLSQGDATQVLTDIGLTIAVGDPVFDNDVAVDEVAAQSPAAGQPVPRGGTITIRPSKGPDYVDMPDLTGMPLPTVRATIQRAGLVVGPILGSTTGTFYAASIDGDQVQPGDQVIRGSTVSLIVL